MNRPPLAQQAAIPARGFTLIEIMVVVVIIGILAAIALPAYGSYLVRGNRGAAQSHLLELAQNQAQYLADSRTYASTVALLGTTTPTAVTSVYTITIALVAGPPPGFTITATPVAGSRQANDGALSINQAGVKTPDTRW